MRTLLYEHIFNEFYARDTSRKIKSVFKAKGMAGKHMTGQVPYGYLWADEKREQWVIDGERIAQYTCAEYGKYPIGTRCKTQHRINASVVLTLIADMLKAIADYSKNDRAEFIKTVQEAQASQQAADITKKKRRLSAAQKRAGEQERLKSLSRLWRNTRTSTP